MMVLAMAGENFAHGLDEIGFRHRKLRGSRLAPLFIGGNGRSGFRALNQVFDLDLAFRLLVAALDDDTGCAASVGIF